jgi:hypothetical protein
MVSPKSNKHFQLLAELTDDLENLSWIERPPPLAAADHGLQVSQKLAMKTSCGLRVRLK